MSRLAGHRALPSLTRLLLILTLALPVGLLGQGARPALAAAGDLDPSFDGDGIVVSSFGTPDSSAAVAVQPDGKIVAAGRAYDLNTGRNVFAVARFGPDGHLDSSFGTAGTVRTEIGTSDAFGEALALQADGKIVVGGRAASTNPDGSLNSAFGLVRYTPDGRLDIGFGDGGKVLTDFGAPGPEFRALALQSDGKIVAAGWFGGCSPSGTCGFTLQLARYNLDGSLDGGFGSGGKVQSPGFPVRAMVVQADGKIVLVGLRFGGSTLARFTPDGAVDGSFGTAGQVSVDDVGASALTLQADGKLVLAGSYVILLGGTQSSGGFGLARYTPDGHPDPAFGAGGRVTAGPAPDADALAVVVQADGKIVAAGGGSSGTFVLVRYTSSGSPDTTFGAGGRVTTTGPAGTFAKVTGLALQSDGKLVAAGGFSENDLALARYQAGGIGGLGFTVSPQPSSVAVSWATGTGQTGYLLARSPAAAWPLAAAATTFTDSAPVRGVALNCYQLVALGASSALAASDALCAQLGVRSQIGPPPGFALRLDESTTARLTWGSSGDQLGYVLLALPQGGTPRTLGLDAAARWATDQTGGTPTCYVLYAVYAAGLGNSDAACAVPGRFSFGATATAAQGAAAAGPQAARAAAAPAVGQQLGPMLQAGQTQVEEQAGKLRRKGR